MARYRTCHFLFPLFLLGGCASTAPTKGELAAAIVDRQIGDAARKIELAQTQLYHATGASMTGTVPVTAKGERTINAAWKGDASGLLRRLAEDRGLAFTEMGVRMPLPVSVDVQNESLDLVLDRMRAQVGYRAVIDRKANALVLLYNRPLP